MTQHDVVRGVLCILGSWAAFGSFGVLIKVRSLTNHHQPPFPWLARCCVVWCVVHCACILLLLGGGNHLLVGSLRDATCTFPCQAPAVVAARVDPLVFQSYKTFAVFVTSWLVLAYNEFQFTYWGIVGSLVWVPSGVLAVIAIRCAGLGVSQGIWSGLAGAYLMVCVLP